MYTLGLVSVSFRQHTPREILEAMRATPLTCIEWGSDVHVPPERATEIATLQAEYGITCSSYGTYFRLGVSSLTDLPQYLQAAKTLGTNIVRLWCGDHNSEDYTETERNALFAESRAAAKIAAENGVILCMECHNHTYTNRKGAAMELMQAVASPHFRMYWQPNQYRDTAENLAYAELLAEFTEHLHVFCWRGDEKFPLCDGADLWKRYLRCFPNDKTLLLEFMPDDRLETLVAEAETLLKIAGGNA